MQRSVLHHLCFPLIITGLLLFATSIASDNDTTSNVLANLGGPLIGAGIVLWGIRRNDYANRERD